MWFFPPFAFFVHPGLHGDNKGFIIGGTLDIFPKRLWRTKMRAPGNFRPSKPSFSSAACARSRQLWLPWVGIPSGTLSPLPFWWAPLLSFTAALWFSFSRIFFFFFLTLVVTNFLPLCRQVCAHFLASFSFSSEDDPLRDFFQFRTTYSPLWGLGSSFAPGLASQCLFPTCRPSSFFFCNAPSPPDTSFFFYFIPFPMRYFILSCALKNLFFSFFFLFFFPLPPSLSPPPFPFPLFPFPSISPLYCGVLHSPLCNFPQFSLILFSFFFVFPSFLYFFPYLEIGDERVSGFFSGVPFFLT